MTKQNGEQIKHFLHRTVKVESAKIVLGEIHFQRKWNRRKWKLPLQLVAIRKKYYNRVSMSNRTLIRSCTYERMKTNWLLD